MEKNRWKTMLKWMRQWISKRSKERFEAPQKRRYKAGATFKGSLFVVAILLVLIYLVHMQLVLRQLKDHEKITSDIYAKFMRTPLRNRRATTI